MYNIHGRPSRKGPESDLVVNFIDSFIPLEKDVFISVLIEPQLINSVPDIVFIYWDRTATNEWGKSRLNLETNDYKLIQFLHAKGAQKKEPLQSFFPRGLDHSLRRLQLSGIIKESKNGWMLNTFKKIFAVKKIITFEAKMSASERALEQALLNLRFSSESYLLTPTSVRKLKTVEQAKKYGVGIWSHSAQVEKPIINAKKQPLPQSYLSWLLNDLVWAYTQGGMNEYKC